MESGQQSVSGLLSGGSVLVAVNGSCFAVSECSGRTGVCGFNAVLMPKYQYRDTFGTHLMEFIRILKGCAVVSEYVMASQWLPRAAFIL